MSIQIQGVLYTNETILRSASVDAASLSVIVNGEDSVGNAFSHSYPAATLSSAEAAVDQVNQAIADGEGGTTEITIIDDF